MECEIANPAICALSILFTDDGEIREINRTYRKKNKATDVLSFPATRVESEYLGDIVISIERARAQAKEAGIPVSRELQRLLVHGALHLVGYDHEGVSARKAKLMFEREEQILTSLN